MFNFTLYCFKGGIRYNGQKYFCCWLSSYFHDFCSSNVFTWYISVPNFYLIWKYKWYIYRTNKGPINIPIAKNWHVQLLTPVTFQYFITSDKYCLINILLLKLEHKLTKVRLFDHTERRVTLFRVPNYILNSGTDRQTER